MCFLLLCVFFFFNDTATTEIYTLSLHDALPISPVEQTIAAVLMIGIVTAINVWGTRKSSDLQNWTTLVKVCIIILLSALLLSFGHHARDIPPAIGVVQHGVGLWSNFGLAMITVLWAYEGWQFGTYSAGEVIDPQKAFPRAFLMGSLILVGLYLVAVVAYLFALGPAEMAMSDTIAATSVTAVLGS